MRLLLTLLLTVHGLIHLMGFAKAFGLARLPQLVQPISRPMGLTWLAAAILPVLAAAAIHVLPRWWWVLGGAAVVLSQIVIFSSWSDARYGTIANVLILAGVVVGFLSQGPTSLRAEYEREAAQVLARRGPSVPISEADLARLPRPLRRYLQASGGEGRERTRNFRARFRGRIRGGPEARWMAFTADQVEAFDEPVRLFYMDATMLGVPVQVLHVYRGATGTMRVRAAGLVTLVDAKGPEIDRSETVTLLNDMCLMAPGSLLDPRIRWEEIDARSARAAFTNGTNTVSAELFFDGDGRLVDFASEDRSQASPDGKRFERMRWTTPLRDQRSFGPWRIGTRAETLWHPEAGAFVYGEFELLDIAHDVGSGGPAPSAP